MNRVAEYYHRVVAARDAVPGEEVIFRWHWPRGTFDERMSALEIAAIVIKQMPAICGQLSIWPETHIQFQALLNRIIQWPAEALNEVVPWIRSVVRHRDGDYVELSLFAKDEQRQIVLNFDMGAAS